MPPRRQRITSHAQDMMTFGATAQQGAPSSRHAGSSSASNNFIPCQEQIFSDGEESDGALLHAAAYTEWQAALASSDSIAGGLDAQQ